MASEAGGRRRQYSSCDACREARAACDASQNGYQPGDTGWAGSCSRCLGKGRECTFEWMSEQRQSHRLFRRNPHSRRPFITANSFVQWTETDLSGVANAAQSSFQSARTGRRSEGSQYARRLPLSPPGARQKYTSDGQQDSTAISEIRDLEEWLNEIFNQCFGIIFSHWVGNDGCPLLNKPFEHDPALPTEIFRFLDGHHTRPPSGPSLNQTASAPALVSDGDMAIEKSLQLAIHAYSVRWLPLVPGAPLLGAGSLEELAEEYWRRARRDMLKIINRVCYRSVLTLLLFGLTAIPTGIPEEEQLDGVTGDICAQTALKHLQKLRGRLRCCQFDGSETPVRADDQSSPHPPHPHPTSEWMDLESRAYWAAIIWDTSAAVTSNLKSVITTGLRGACSEPAWILSRGFLTDSFKSKSSSWFESKYEVCDDVATQIIQAASVCRLYTWRTIASFKEALGEGAHEDSVQPAWKAVLEAIDIFETTIRPLLDLCEKALHFLSQTNRFNWYETVLHHYLGIMILFDTTETEQRKDLSLELSEMGLDAKRQAFNVVAFGLKSTYQIRRPTTVMASGVARDSCDPTSNQVLINAPFIAVDPYPHYVVLLIQLLEKTITRQYRDIEVTRETYAYLLSILCKAVETLPQTSRFVCDTHASLKQLAAKLQ